MRILIAVICLSIGMITGALISQHIALENDFSRTMQLRLLAGDSMTAGSPHKITLRLLDLYENGIRRQTSSFASNKFDWQQELMDIELRRYVIFSADHNENSAGQALVNAAKIRNKGQSATDKEVDFCKQLAERLYGAKP